MHTSAAAGSWKQDMQLLPSQQKPLPVHQSHPRRQQWGKLECVLSRACNWIFTGGHYLVFLYSSAEASIESKTGAGGLFPHLCL